MGFVDTMNSKVGAAVGEGTSIPLQPFIQNFWDGMLNPNSSLTEEEKFAKEQGILSAKNSFAGKVSGYCEIGCVFGGGVIVAFILINILNKSQK